MAEWLDDLFANEQAPQFVDADTVRTPEGDVRIQGINAYEQGKIVDGQYVPGQVGGLEATQLSTAMANQQGFNQVVSDGQRDTYGRLIGDLVNPETGELWSNQSLKSGLSNVSLYSSKEQVRTAMQGRLDRMQRKATGEQNEWDIAGQSLRDFRAQSLAPLHSKEVALDEATYNRNPQAYIPFQTQIGDSAWQWEGTDLHGDYGAKSSIKTAFAMGSSSIEEGLWGAWDLVGDVFGFDGGGQAEVERVQREIQQLPQLRNLEAFDHEGNWRLDSASKTFDFLITNAAMSAPYMIQSIAAAALSPVTLGASWSIPALTYIGQTYTEQGDNKDAASAIISGVGQAALERFGIKGVTGANKFIKDPAVRKKVVKELADSKFNGNLKAADAALGNYTMKQLKGISEAAKQDLQRKFSNKYIETAKGGGIAALKGGAAESITEVGQELLGALGASHFNVDELNGQELQNRLLNAAVAGGVLGGTLSGVGGARGTFREVAQGDYDTQADLSKTTDDYKYQEELKQQGKGTDINSLLLDTSDGTGNINDFSAPEYKRRKGQSSIQKAVEFADKGIGNLWRGWMASENNRFADRGQYVRDIFSLYGGNKIRSGASMETFQHLKESELNNILGTEEEATTMFNVGSIHQVSNILRDAEVTDALTRVAEAFNSGKGPYSSYKEAYHATGITLPAKYAQQADAIIEYGSRLDQHDSAVADFSNQPKEFGGALNKKTFNKGHIASNQASFIDTLMKKGYSRREAEGMLNDILDLDFINAAEDFNDDFLSFDQTTSIDPSKLQLLNKDPDMQKFFNNDVWYNMSALNGTIAAREANRKYYGKDGAVPAKLIQQALDAGEIDQAEAQYIAAEIHDYMKVRSGEYNRIQSASWKAFQQNALFISTLNQLPLAAVSSLVELGLVSRGLTEQTIFGDISRLSKNSAREIATYFSNGANAASRGKVKKLDTLKGDRKALAELGFLQESQSVAQKHDIRPGENKQQVINQFFGLTGLKGLTNLTRTLRLSLAADAVNGWVFDIANAADINTKQSVEAREALINLGVDVDWMVNMQQKTSRGHIMTQEEAAYNAEQMRLASFNFVNDAVAHPTKANRPKFYQNPRTALFFQFQGFIATFTANILPKILRQATANNSPLSSKTDALVTIATLLALGFLSQYIKDLIKYGEETPYLDDAQKFQRALGASGLLGTGERVLNFVHPLYDQRAANPLESMLDAVSGEAPALGYGGKVADAVTEIFTGGDNIGKKVVKAAPLTGPFNKIADSVNNAVNDIF